MRKAIAAVLLLIGCSHVANAIDDPQQRAEMLNTCRDADPREAIVACTFLIEMPGTEVLASHYLYRGIAYHKLKQFADALRNFNLAIEAHGPDSRLVGWRARAHDGLGQIERAITETDYAIRLSASPSAAMLLSRGILYERNGQLDRAFDDFNAALETSDSTKSLGSILGHRGIVRSKRKDFERAIMDFTLALDAGAPKPTMLAWRADAYRALGQTERALADLDQAVAVGNLPAHMVQRGLIYERMDQLDSAISDYDAALARDPNLVRAQELKARARSKKMGRVTEPQPSEDSSTPAMVRLCAQARSRLSLLNNETVLCMRGQITSDLDLDQVRKLRNNGHFVVRSSGGTGRVAMQIADILHEKKASVIVYDHCLSACANFLLVAGDRTFVKANTVVAWHSTPEMWHCRPEIPQVRQADCEAATREYSASRSEFFKKRGIDPFYTYEPPTPRAKEARRILLGSGISERQIFWMWHPNSYKDHFNGRVMFESYPANEADTQRIMQQQNLTFRLIYDPG